MHFQECKNKDDNCQAEEFWAEILNYRDSSGEQCFKDLRPRPLSYAGGQRWIEDRIDGWRFLWTVALVLRGYHIVRGMHSARR
ncbi:hypothetical protein AALO_G00287680 [Alosa alosa]|uniref:Uncharacterized protein n=1 Tax=Alosa alosa TaxID=278164 RepID=A0AAV6FKW6_9TELE|nr:hypothetical protein AALO_G00287680 [Alosa alosa]